MLTVLVILAILLVGLLLIGLSCAPQDALDISATELDNGVFIENVSNVDCLVFVTSPEGEQRFELAAGENETVTNVTKPIEISAITLKR